MRNSDAKGAALTDYLSDPDEGNCDHVTLKLLEGLWERPLHTRLGYVRQVFYF